MCFKIGWKIRIVHRKEKRAKETTLGNQSFNQEVWEVATLTYPRESVLNIRFEDKVLGTKIEFELEQKSTEPNFIEHLSDIEKVALSVLLEGKKNINFGLNI